MLEELHVTDLALIQEAWLEFGPGMTVLTGETGAGKTALIGAIKLLVGERADSSMVRSGSSNTAVEGRIKIGDDEIVAQRRVSADGRSRCTLNAQMSSVGGLATELGPLFDLHGQHEHQALLRPGEHVGYLDRVIGDEASEARAAYGDAYREHKEARRALAVLEERLALDRERAEYLRFVVNEIDTVAPAAGEDEELESVLPQLRHGERLSAAAREAYALIHGDAGASDALAQAQTALARVAALDPALDVLAQELEAASASIEQACSAFRDYGESIEHDPQRLDAVESRLAVLGTLKKKHGRDIDGVLAIRDDARVRLEALESGDRGLIEARERVASARASLERAGRALVEVRTGAQDRFCEALTAQAAELAMEDTRFGVTFEELEFDDWSPDGPHRVEFVCAAGPDQPLRPLAKIASGGEVSRVMLALKTVLGAADQVPILVFDEIDAGIGGATATAVGRKLADLARRHQVLVVTHLAQVAAYADFHMVVRKDVDAGVVRTSVSSISGGDRVAEVARMLSGEDSAASLAHAQELIGNADRERVTSA